MSEHTKGELIAMQKNLGLGHKGDIWLTTQERVDTNQEPITKDIIDENYAKELVRRWNAFEKQPPAGEFTKKLREEYKPFMNGCRWNIDCGDAFKELCDRLDSAEAKVKGLLEACENLRGFVLTEHLAEVREKENYSCPKSCATCYLINKGLAAIVKAKP